MTVSNELTVETHHELDAWNLISRLSHTFRTPLNHVLGFAEILEAGSFGPLDERQVKYVSRIQAAGRRQLQLLDQLVDIARASAGDLVHEVKSFGLKSLIDYLIKDNELMAQGKHIRMVGVADDGASVIGDFNHTRHVADNLIEFALKRAADGSTVMVTGKRIAPGVPDDPALQICVSYNGGEMSLQEVDLLAHGAPGEGNDQLHDVEGLGLLHAHVLTRHLGGELHALANGSDIEMTLHLPELRVE